MNRFLLYLFCFLIMLWLGGLLVSSTYLPERVASQFGSDGAVSGWTEQNAFVRTFFFAGAVMAAGVPGLLWAVRFVPGRFVNLPEASQRWLEPEFRPGFDALVLRMGLWIGMAHLLFVGSMYAMIFAANRLQPPRMDNSLVGMAAMVYLALIMLVILLHLVPLMKRPQSASNALMED